MTAETEKMLLVEAGGGLKGSTLSLALHPIFRALGTGWTPGFTCALTGDLFRTDVPMRLEPGPRDAPPQKLRDLFGRLGFRFQALSAERASGDFTEIQESAWEAVCASIDQGVPAIGWQMMSPRQAIRGLPSYGYSLIRGYETQKREYALFHAAAGEFRVRYDSPGQLDGVFWVGLFKMPRLEDNASLWHQALKFAVRHACQAEDPHMGLRGLDYWIEALRNGEIAQYAGADTAAFLMERRDTAAALLRDMSGKFNDSSLRAAALAYEEEAVAYRAFLSAFPRYVEGGPGNHSNPETCLKGIKALTDARRAQEKAVEAIGKR